VVNRSKKFELPILELMRATEKFVELGVKTVEITGGGEPLCYSDLDLYLEFLEPRVKIGLITNGVGINKHKYFLEDVSWIRISANVFDYTGEIEIPEGFTGTLGFSYVWTSGLSTTTILEQIKEIALKNNVKYIRLVPNCIATKEEQERNNEFLAQIAEQIGEPLFFQPKEFNIPSNCYWGYLKPFLYADGYVYPCSSTVLNPDADKQFNSIYRLCHWTDVNKVWKSEIKSMVNTKRCEHCVFTPQNQMLEYALNEQEHEDFI
jgi:MoaA/NifB/PqqE/SkfB family radical SAM enzyme